MHEEIWWENEAYLVPTITDDSYCVCSLLLSCTGSLAGCAGRHLSLTEQQHEAASPCRSNRPVHNASLLSPFSISLMSSTTSLVFTSLDGKLVMNHDYVERRSSWIAFRDKSNEVNGLSYESMHHMLLHVDFPLHYQAIVKFGQFV